MTFFPHKIHQTIDYLKTHGYAIGEAAANGDELALVIVDWYKILCRATGDPGAQMVLTTSVNEWKRLYPNTPVNPAQEQDT